MTTGKKPWMKFFPADWRQDPRLRMCDLATRGLWMEMLCLMAEGEPYGHLTVGGAPIKDSDLARLVGADLKTVRKSLHLLSHVGVCSTTSSGVVFSRRMVSDHAKALKDKENGKAGGNPALTGGVNPKDKTHAGEARVQSLERTPKAPTTGPAQPAAPGGVAKDSGIKAADLRDPIASMVERLLTAFPEFAKQGGNGGLLDTSPIMRLVAAGGCDLDLDVEPTITGILARKPARPPNSWTYFRQPIERARDERLASVPKGSAPAPAVTVDASGVLVADPDGVFRVPCEGGARFPVDHERALKEFWSQRLAPWVYQGTWNPRSAGPAPGEPGCIVPPAVLEKAYAWKAEHAEKRRLLRESLAMDDRPSVFGDASPSPVSTHH